MISGICEVLGHPRSAARVLAFLRPSEAKHLSGTCKNAWHAQGAHKGKDNRDYVVCGCIAVASREQCRALAASFVHTEGFIIAGAAYSPAPPPAAASGTSFSTFAEEVRAAMPCKERFYLSYTGRRGWGVFSLTTIPKGTMVATYTGELVRTHELHLRQREEYDAEGLNYVITLREESQTCVCFRTNIDATRAGNISRFFNHSCDASLSANIMRRPGEVLPEVVFVSRRVIAVGDELTFDYGQSDGADGDDQGDDEKAMGNQGKKPRLGAKPCLCGSPLCRGTLPYDPTV